MNERKREMQLLGYRIGRTWASRVATQSQLGSLRKLPHMVETQNKGFTHLSRRDAYMIGERLYFGLTPTHHGNRKAAGQFWAETFEVALEQGHELALINTDDLGFMQAFIDGANERASGVMTTSSVGTGASSTSLRSIRVIPLMHGKYALVDELVFSALSIYTWREKRTKDSWNPIADIMTGEGTPSEVCMHREVLRLFGKPLPRRTYRRNGCGLDCRIENISFDRISPPKGNRSNRGQNICDLTGVTWVEDLEMWGAIAPLHGGSQHLGFFHDWHSAAWVVQEFLTTLHGGATVPLRVFDRRSGGDRRMPQIK